MCRGHLVGNGSSTMVLTSALRDIGGWDPDPRLDGNEDYKAFFTLAERGEFVVVRSHLLGYRQTQDNKSSKSRKMLASYDQVVAQFRSRHPEHEQAFTTGRQELIAYLFDRAVLSRHFSAVAYLFAEAFDQDPARAYALLARTPLIIGRLVVPLPIRALWRKQNANRPRRATRFNSSDIAPEMQAPTG